MGKKIAKIILKEQPIQLIGLLGNRELNKDQTNMMKICSQSMKLLAKLGNKNYSKGVDIRLILANTHGRFNGYQDFDEYLRTNI